jgi:hypothetical protein
MHKLIAAAVILSGVAASTAEARRRPAATWSVSRSSDPITGVTRCTVAALDRAGRIRFTRIGAIYPVVEMNSRFGLLVGVSSGGQVRLPTGDILWRVDDRPFRTLRAQDNPIAEASTGSADPANGALAQAYRLSAAMTATSTMASAGLAREMLEELLIGRELIYRQSTAAADVGLANPNSSAVGQITREGLVPYKLDDSFREGLRTCGVQVLTHN